MVKPKPVLFALEIVQSLMERVSSIDPEVVSQNSQKRNIEEKRKSFSGSMTLLYTFAECPAIDIGNCYATIGIAIHRTPTIRWRNPLIIALLYKDKVKPI